jgi:uncharacterized membrane protein
MEVQKMIQQSDKSFFAKNKEFIVLIVAGLIYSSISLVNNFLFRTYFNDLGLYTNAMYNYVHGNWQRSLIFAGGEHIDLWLILFSPLSLVFGSYALLLLQIVFILAGGLGVYRYIFLVSNNRMLSLLSQVHFYFFFGIFTALSFDYHSNVPAAMLVPWFFLFLKKEKWINAGFIFFLIIIAKENMPLWMMFITSGLLFLSLKIKKNQSHLPQLIIPSGKNEMFRMLLILFVISTSYFIFLSQWFMPKYSFAVIGHLNDYKLLGGSPLAAIGNLFSHPVEMIKAFFTNHTGNPEGDYLKPEFLLLLVISGGWILIVRPAYLWMCLPLFAQKLLTDNPQFWGLGGQYAIEFAPIITIGIYEFFALQKKKPVDRGATKFSFLKVAAVLSASFCIIGCFRVLDHTHHAFIDKAAIRFYQERHFVSHTPCETAEEAYRQIPGDAALSVQTHLAPHAALREKIYLYPEINDAEYILLQLNGPGFYPLTKEEFLKMKDSLLESKRWIQTWQKDSLIILQKCL